MHYVSEAGSCQGLEQPRGAVCGGRSGSHNKGIAGTKVPRCGNSDKCWEKWVPEYYLHILG